MRKLAITLCAMSVSLVAQWPNRPTPGLPRTADGKPNLAAAAPRASDGKPDLSGVWEVRNSSSYFYLTSDLKPGEIQPWAQKLFQQREEDFRRDTDGISCLPPGPKAGIGVGNLPMKIVQTPPLTVILYEYQTIFRQIFTDGRGMPADPNPTWMGYSVGHWDEDTLVVTTAGYNDRTSIDLAGHPHTEALRVTERFRRPTAGHLELKITYDDPKAYTRSWTVPIDFDLVPDGDLIEYVCENERDKSHLVGKRGEEFPVPAGVLAQYAGTYQAPNLPNGIVVSLVADANDAGRLMINTGEGNVPLFAQTETMFTMEGTGVEFNRDAKGAVVGMTQHWNEGDRFFPRRK